MCVRSERERFRWAKRHAEIRQNATEYIITLSTVPAMRGFVFACVCLCVRGSFAVGTSLAPLRRVHV